MSGDPNDPAGWHTRPETVFITDAAGKCIALGGDVRRVADALFLLGYSMMLGLDGSEKTGATLEEMGRVTRLQEPKGQA